MLCPFLSSLFMYVQNFQYLYSTQRKFVFSVTPIVMRNIRIMCAIFWCRGCFCSSYKFLFQCLDTSARVLLPLSRSVLPLQMFLLSLQMSQLSMPMSVLSLIMSLQSLAMSLLSLIMSLPHPNSTRVCGHYVLLYPRV